MAAPARLSGPLGAGWHEFGSSLRQLAHFLRLRQGLQPQRRKCRQLKVLRNLLEGSARPASSRLAATAAASPDPDASGSTPAAPPAKPPATSWRDVLMGNSPDDRHTIQALVAEVEQLKKLINNNRARPTASMTTAGSTAWRVRHRQSRCSDAASGRTLLSLA